MDRKQIYLLKTFKHFTYMLFFVTLFGYCGNSYAQKLPNMQTIPVATPSTLKIDGKADEWNGEFQAHNNATNLFYTIANNDNFIYLIIHAEDPDVVNTLTQYGFTFGVQIKRDKQKENKPVTIRFPLDEIPRLGLVLNRANIERDTTASVLKAVKAGNNNILQQRHKTLIVNGIAGMDTLSVYNDIGLRVAEAFDDKRNYTLEIQIPIRYLNLSKTSKSILSYHLLVNGFSGSKAATVPRISPPNLTPEQAQAIADLDIRIAKRLARTDFWGEYTLAKKP